METVMKKAVILLSVLLCGCAVFGDKGQTPKKEIIVNYDTNFAPTYPLTSSSKDRLEAQRLESWNALRPENRDQIKNKRTDWWGDIHNNEDGGTKAAPRYWWNNGSETPALSEGEARSKPNKVVSTNTDLGNKTKEEKSSSDSEKISSSETVNKAIDITNQSATASKDPATNNDDEKTCKNCKKAK